MFGRNLLAILKYSSFNEVPSNPKTGVFIALLF